MRLMAEAWQTFASGSRHGAPIAVPRSGQHGRRDIADQQRRPVQPNDPQRLPVRRHAPVRHPRRPGAIAERDPAFPVPELQRAADLAQQPGRGRVDHILQGPPLQAQADQPDRGGGKADERRELPSGDGGGAGGRDRYARAARGGRRALCAPGGAAVHGGVGPALSRQPFHNRNRL